MLFINTRPQDRAAELTQQLEAAQIAVTELPLLELMAVPYSIELQQLFQQLGRASIIVVVSPTAVEIGMQYLRQSGIALSTLADVQWIAVGKKTEQVLRQYGIRSHVPEIETSEGMLQLPVLAELAPNAVIAFWRGEGGRQFMMRHLHQQGNEILNFVLYKRQCPPQSAQSIKSLLPHLQQQARYWVLISSEASWLNWLELIDHDIFLINKGIYLVLGPRLARILEEFRQNHSAAFQVTQLENLNAEVILREIEQVQGR